MSQGNLVQHGWDIGALEKNGMVDPGYQSYSNSLKKVEISLLVGLRASFSLFPCASNHGEAGDVKRLFDPGLLRQSHYSHSRLCARDTRSLSSGT